MSHSRGPASAWLRQVLGTCFVAGAWASWSGSALAQPAMPASGSCAATRAVRPTPSTSGAGAPAAAEQSSAQQVAALYQSFECHFARGEYAACLPYLEQACRLTDSPRCLLNLGAVHHALMHCQLARGYYQRYLDRAPYDEDVSAARAALEELGQACPQPAPPVVEEAPAHAAGSVAPEQQPGDEAAAAALAVGVLGAVALPAAQPAAPATAGSPAPSAAPEHLAERRRDHVLAWSLLGASAASLTATVVVAAYGARAERDYEERARTSAAPSRGADTELRAIDARGRRYNQLALGLGIVSGLLAGAGTTLWLGDVWLGDESLGDESLGDESLGDESREQAHSGAGLYIAPDGTATLGYSGWF